MMDEKKKTDVTMMFEEHVKHITVSEVFHWIEHDGTPHIKEMYASIFGGAKELPYAILNSPCQLDDFVLICTEYNRDTYKALTMCAVCAACIDDNAIDIRGHWMRVAAYLLLFTGEFGAYGSEVI